MTQINKNDITRVRELAKQYMELVNSEENQTRKKSFILHNTLRGSKPIIIMESNFFIMEYPQMQECICTTFPANHIEFYFVNKITEFNEILDDRLLNDYFPVEWKINYKLFNLDINIEHAIDEQGHAIGFKQDHPIVDIINDYDRVVKPSFYSIDRCATIEFYEQCREIIGDIIPIKFENNSLNWETPLTRHLIDLLGMENMYIAMVDEPEQFHKLMKYLTDQTMEYILWQQKEKLLIQNTDGLYAGSGSYGYTDEFMQRQPNEFVPLNNMWVNLNSQETVGISPAQYGEFFYPHFKDFASKFGLVYYGCCEPIDAIWDKYISKLPNLRKVSISPWCKEEFMGEVLKGSNIIYCRKPNPIYLGVGNDFDEQAFKEHIRKTVQCTKGCKVEFSFRDIYTLNKNIKKVNQAINIVRNMTE